VNQAKAAGKCGWKISTSQGISRDDPKFGEWPLVALVHIPQEANLETVAGSRRMNLWEDMKHGILTRCLDPQDLKCVKWTIHSMWFDQCRP
jgi:streptogramin lyase